MGSSRPLRKTLNEEAVRMLKGGKGLARAAILSSIIMILLCGQAIAATLGPTSKGDAVTALQKNLKAKGYYSAKLTKTYTSTLFNAVRTFQKANSIQAKKLGYADDETQAKAASADAVTYEQYQEKLADGQLQPGGSGTHVKKAQKYLKKLGYYSGGVNGKYNASTEAAVRLFQTANGLSGSGRADRATRAALYSKSAITRAKYDAANYLTPLKYGAKGAQVTQLQEKLREKGFYWDDPNGRFDTQTKYSVKLFQLANGYSTNGKASRTLRALLNAGTSQHFELITKSASNKALSTKSKAGLDVAALQVRLRELGYYKGVINGVYSASVVTAVKKFQTFNYPAVKITGSADTETRTLMNDPKKALSYSDVCGSDTLKTGSKGEAVVNLQKKLNELGYYNGKADGIYDSGVASAVKLFQKYNNLYQSGIAYTQTLKALDNASAVSYPKAKIEALIAVADKLMDSGAKYSTSPTPPKSFDCSRFTAYCLKKVGIYVTGEVQAQGKSSIGRKITITNNTKYSELKRGDILFFWSPDRKKKPGHSAIYLGNNKFIHASSGAGKVTVSAFKTYNERSGGPWFLWAIRIWE